MTLSSSGDSRLSKGHIGGGCAIFQNHLRLLDLDYSAPFGDMSQVPDNEVMAALSGLHVQGSPALQTVTTTYVFLDNLYVAAMDSSPVLLSARSSPGIFWKRQHMITAFSFPVRFRWCLGHWYSKKRNCRPHCSLCHDSSPQQLLIRLLSGSLAGCQKTTLGRHPIGLGALGEHLIAPLLPPPAGPPSGIPPFPPRRRRFHFLPTKVWSLPCSCPPDQPL